MAIFYKFLGDDVSTTPSKPKSATIYKEATIEKTPTDTVQHGVGYDQSGGMVVQ